MASRIAIATIVNVQVDDYISKFKHISLVDQSKYSQEQKKNIELEMQRKMNEERIVLEGQIKKESEETHRLKLMEKEKQIEQMKKSLDDAQRKADQGSILNF